MTDSRDEHETYGFTESPVIAKMQADIARLTAERDEARAQAERWEDDALRLLNERNAAQAERDEARMQVCILGAVTTKLKQAPKTTLAEAMQIAEKFGWDCFSNEESGK
jgi:Na+-translocating ferredoxin:NAD+ oxidoreductase RnfC subunit